MLRVTHVVLKIKSHTRPSNRHPLGGSKAGRDYNRSYKRYAFGGWGMSTYAVGKDRRYLPKDIHGVVQPPADDSSGYTHTTRTLSSQFRTFALNDGGVLVVHPTHRGVMEFSAAALKKEREVVAAGAGGGSGSGGATPMDQHIDARIQAIIANNTIEHVSLSNWRRMHMWNLIRHEGKIKKNWGTDPTTSALRTFFISNRNLGNLSKHYK